MINININNKDYKVNENTTVLEACKQAKVNIPTLCYDERLEPDASCNICVVEVEGEAELKTSCSLKVKEGMKVLTHSDKVIEARKKVLRSLLSKLPEDYTNYQESDQSKFYVYCNEYEISSELSPIDRESLPIDDDNIFYNIDPNKCIQCNLCIRVCDELQGRGVLEYNDKGYISRKSLSDDRYTVSNGCEDCGSCIAVCPTGALMPNVFDQEFAEIAVPGGDIKQEAEDSEEPRHVRTTCSYCGVGCQMDLVVKNETVVDVKPVNILPNKGLLCVKGRFGYKFINHPDRLKTPLIKKDGNFVEATWEEAYDLITTKAKELKDRYSGNVFGGLSSARCTNEANYLFQKLIRGVFGSNNVDHCARL